MPLCGLTNRATWPNSCNLNLYDGLSDAVGWHADDEEIFATSSGERTIISLSLGQARRFELRKKLGNGTVHRVSLGAGDLCTMSGHTQTFYEHRVPPQGTGTPGVRVNLTWRWVVQHHGDCPCQSRSISLNNVVSSSGEAGASPRSSMRSAAAEPAAMRAGEASSPIAVVQPATVHRKCWCGQNHESSRPSRIIEDADVSRPLDG